MRCAGIEFAGFARRDAKKAGVELIDVIDEAAKARVDLAGRLGVGIIERVDVPVVFRDFGDAVAALFGGLPKGGGRVGAAGKAASHRDDRERFGLGFFEGAHAGAFLSNEAREFGGGQLVEVGGQLGVGGGLVRGFGRVDRDAGAHGEQIVDERFGRGAVEQDRRCELQVEALFEQDFKVDCAQRVEPEVQKVLVGEQLFVCVKAEEFDHEVEHKAREQALFFAGCGLVEASDEIELAAHRQSPSMRNRLGWGMEETTWVDGASEGGAAS